MIFTLYSFGAFFLAILSIIGIISIVSLALRWPGRLFQFLMLLILTASVGSILLSGRTLTFSEQGLTIASDVNLDAGSGLVAKLLLILVIGCAFSLCIAWILFKNNAKLNNFHQKYLISTPSNDIAIAFMVFYIAFSILPIFFGKVYYFHVALIYPFFIFLALFLWMPFSKTNPVNIAKQCLAIIVLGSLVAAIIAPELALQPGYTGLVPGFNLRLWGITANANTLGSVAAVLLVLEVAESTKRKWLSFIILCASACTLILTQSKTSLMAAILGLTICYVWRVLAGLNTGNTTASKNNAMKAIALIAGVSITAATIGAWVMFSDTSLLAAIEGKLATRAVGDMTTATGRTLIWQLAIQGGLENPIFGQGADFWGLENRLRYGYTGAIHAHNLFLQVFSRSGFIGLTSLLVFLYFLIKYSFRASIRTRGGSISLLVVLLIRSIFEVPIQPNSILGAEFFAMMSIFLYAIDKGKISASNLQRQRPLAQRLFNGYYKK